MVKNIIFCRDISNVCTELRFTRLCTNRTPSGKITKTRLRFNRVSTNNLIYFLAAAAGLAAAGAAAAAAAGLAPAAGVVAASSCFN